MTSFINGAPIDDTGKLLVTTVTPLPTWPFLGGLAYDPVTTALAVKDAVPAANDPWNDGIRNTHLGQMYVTSVLPVPIFYVHGLPISADGRLFMSVGPPTGSVGGWPISGDGGVSGSGLSPQPMFFAPLMTTLVPTTAGNPTFTFARAALAYAMDFEGILRQASQNEARFQGARRVKNWVPVSQDFTNVAWTKQSVTIAPATGPTGLADATTVTAQVSTGNAQLYINASGVGGIARTSWWVRRRTGTGIVKLRSQDNATETDITAQLDGTWKRFAAAATPVTTPWVVLTMMVTGDQVDVTYVQTEDVSGQSNQAPGDYVSVGVLGAEPYHGNKIDGVKYFATRNGNSVGPGANLALQSQTFNLGGAWGNTNINFGPDATTAPDGTTTAESLTDTTLNGLHRLSQFVSTPLVVGTRYTFSLYLKAVTLPWVQILIYDGSSYYWTNVDLATGALGNKAATATAVSTPVGNGWYRVSVTSPVAAGTAGEIHIYGIDSNVAISRPTYAGSGQSVYVWGAQLEVGLVATGYNPTTSAPASVGNVVTEATGTPIPLATTLGYVAENAATNICAQSQTFDNAGWTKTNAVIAADNIAAPDGTLTADRFTDDATNTFHLAFTAGGIAHVASATYTASVYVKQGTLPWMQLLATTGAGIVAWANFNLATGAVGFTMAGTTSAVATLPNGWFRVSITYATGAGTAGNLQLFSINANVNVAQPPYVGTGQTMYLWGAQVEQASDPSSYIATTTGQVSRAGDALSYAAVSNVDGSLGTSYAEAYSPSAWASDQQDVLMNATPTYYFQYYPVAKTLGMFSGSAVLTANTRTIGAINKNASAWGGTTRSVCLNGGAVAAGAYSGVVLSGPVRVGGSPTAGEELRGCVRNVNFYSVRLTDAELIAKTAP